MRPVHVTQPRNDCLLVHVGRDWRASAAWGLPVVALVALLARADLGAGPTVAAFVTAAVALPFLAVRALRALGRRERSLVRAPARLLLDGEPLELARVELRMLRRPVTRVPTGYALSLWVMTATGPEDVPLGVFPTLVEASAASGQVEDFVQRAGLKQPRHV